MLNIDAINFLFEERQDLKSRGELSKVLHRNDGWGGDALYELLINKHLSPYWALIRSTSPTLPKIISKSFSGKDMSGLNLSQLNFSDCRFMNTRLVGCDLSNTAFSKCSFTNSVLEGTTWSGARMYKCDLRRAKVSGANFSGLVYRMSKTPETLPGHRSHARKQQVEGRRSSYAGEIRRFLVPGKGVVAEDGWRGVGTALAHYLDNKMDMSCRVIVICGGTSASRESFFRSNHSALTNGMLKIVVMSEDAEYLAGLVPLVEGLGVPAEIVEA